MQRNLEFGQLIDSSTLECSVFTPFETRFSIGNADGHSVAARIDPRRFFAMTYFPRSEKLEKLDPAHRLQRQV